MKKEQTEEPVVIVDTREQTPLVFAHLRSEAGTLMTGDYSVRGLEEEFAVERKSMQDLVGSLTRERARFMREMHRLRGFRARYLLVVGTMQELYGLESIGRANIKQVQNSLSAIQGRYGVVVCRVDSPERGAVKVETWAWVAWRDAWAKVGRRVGFPDWVEPCMR